MRHRKSRRDEAADPHEFELLHPVGPHGWGFVCDCGVTATEHATEDDALDAHYTHVRGEQGE